jgi:hypothetical protein
MACYLGVHVLGSDGGWFAMGLSVMIATSVPRAIATSVHFVPQTLCTNDHVRNANLLHKYRPIWRVAVGCQSKPIISKWRGHVYAQCGASKRTRPSNGVSYRPSWANYDAPIGPQLGPPKGPCGSGWGHIWPMCGINWVVSQTKP